MALGILPGYFVPSTRQVLDSSKLIGVSLPIAIGLLWMMYPILCQVKYESLPQLLKSKDTIKILSLSMFMNWIVAPLFMTALAWITLFDQVEYRTGIILVGVARCIAMVLIWNRLAGGSPEWCAILVAINSILQVFLFAPFSYFYTFILGKGTVADISIELVAKSVFVFLGIPLLAAVITRFTIRNLLKKDNWYDTVFLRFIGPTSLLGLLFTIIVMFALQGRRVIENIGDVFRISVPLIVYFMFIFFGTLFICYKLKVPYDVAISQSFTASGNNFELAIAVAIVAYGIDSKEALATVIGPLVEVPVLLLIVNIVVRMKGCYIKRVDNEKEANTPGKNLQDSPAAA